MPSDQSRVARHEAGVAGAAYARSRLVPARAGAGVALRMRLTDRQRLVWIEDQMHPGVPVNNVLTLLRVHGALDPERFRVAFDAVVAVHPALRTRVELAGDEFVQCWLEEPSTLDVVDLRSGNNGGWHGWLDQWCRRTFALGGRLYDAALVRVADGEWTFCCNQHHSITDGLSCVNLHRALERAYGGGELVSDSSFLDHVAARQGDAGDEARRFWAQHLAAPEAIALYGRDTRHKCARTARVETTLDAELCDAVWARRDGRSPSLLFAAVANAWLARVSGAEITRLGVPLLNRTAGADHGLGLFMEVVPNVLGLRGGESFAAIADSVREEVERVRPWRECTVSSSLAGYEVLLNVHTPSLASFAGLPAHYELTTPLNLVGALQNDSPGDDWRGREALTIQVHHAEPERRLRLAFDCNRAVFPTDDDRRRALSHFTALLRAFVEQPERIAAAVPIVTADERRHLVRNTPPVPRGVCDDHVVGAFERRAAATPERVAVEHGARQITYGELAHRVRGLAGGLRQRGVGPDDLVCVLLPRGVDMVVAMLAVLRVGAAYVPLDPTHPEERIQMVLADAAPRLVLCTRATRPAGLDERLGVAIDALGADAAGADAGPTVGEIAYVIFTSGSTGRPKGVRVRHDGLRVFLAAMSAEPGCTAGDRVLAVTTISFDIAVLELLLPLVVGATIVLADAETAMDGVALAALIRDRRVTAMQATPATYRMLLQSGWPGDPGLRVLCGGEALTAELAAALRPRVGSLWNMYGPTETTVWSSVHRVEAVDGVVPIGHAIAGTRLYVLDAHRNLVPAGVAGELVIAGSGVAEGYHGRPDLTRERFLDDPVLPESGERAYCTGDLVRARAGEPETYDYLGRSDFQVKVRGFRIELGEIESVLEAMPGIRQAVVSTWVDASGERALVAYVVPDGEAPPAKAMLEHVRSRLPAYMVPAVWMPVARLPLTPNGKVDRKRLPAVAATAAAAVATEIVEPRDDAERLMLEIWREKLRVERFGVTDDFFDLGGHSMLVLQLVRAIANRFGRQIPLVQVFRNPTIASLVASMRAGADTGAHVIPLRDEGDGPLLYGICGIHLYQDVANELAGTFRTHGVYIPADEHVAAAPSDADRARALARDYWSTIAAHAAGRPFSLLGLCFGGMVAFEVAALASAEGADVRLLALADSPLWTHMRRAHWRRVRGALSRVVREGPKAVWRRFRARSAAAAPNATAANGNDRAPRDERVDVLRDLVWVFRPSTRYAGPTVLVRSRSEELYGTWREDPMLGWSSYLTGRLWRLAVDCGHLDVVKGEAARQLAALIRDVSTPRTGGTRVRTAP